MRANFAYNMFSWELKLIESEKCQTPLNFGKMKH